MLNAPKSPTISPLSERESEQAIWPFNLGIPIPVQWALLFFLPLLGCGYWLFSKLSGLPSEAWEWTIFPGAMMVAVALVPLNWWIESLKWAELMPWGRMPRRMREVLYGTAWSMVGPFRLGAGIGRVTAVPPRERNMAMRAFAAASVSQWWCTITATAIGLLCMQLYLPAALMLVVSSITLGIYLGWSPKFWKYLKKTSWMGNWGKTKRIPTVRRKRALSLSIFRYFVMLSQFIFMLNAFGHLTTWSHSVDRFYAQGQGVALTWGLTSLAPMPAFGDLGIREAAALFAIDASTPEDITAIIAATLSLWIINLLIPSLVGLIWHANAQRKRNNIRAKLAE